MNDRSGKNIQMGDRLVLFFWKEGVETIERNVGKVVGINNACQYVEVLVEGTSDRLTWQAEKVDKIDEG